jgi:hypothetical protein
MKDVPYVVTCGMVIGLGEGLGKDRKKRMRQHLRNYFAVHLEWFTSRKNFMAILAVARQTSTNDMERNI